MFEWAIKYREQFGVAFPIWGVADRSAENVIATIQKCLDENKPIIPIYESGKDY